MERVKDFLYDISDLFFSLLIIALIFFVVSVKLNDTMTDTWFSNIPGDTAEALDFVADVTTPDLNNPVVDLETLTPDETVDAIEPTEPVVEVREVRFEIPSGSSGYQIATKLQKESLISTVDEFTKKLDEMKLGNKLRAGNHQLNTGMTVEEIILKLSGQ